MHALEDPPLLASYLETIMFSAYLFRAAFEVVAFFPADLLAGAFLTAAFFPFSEALPRKALPLDTGTVPILPGSGNSHPFGGVPSVPGRLPDSLPCDGV